MKDLKDKKELLVLPTPSFRLKDSPHERSFMPINLKVQFGFIPEFIIIEKVPNKNNRLIIKAVLTDEEIKKYKSKNKK